MTIDLVLCIVCGILLIAGLVGTVVPVLPGVPLAWAGLMISYFSSYTELSVVALVLTGILAIAVSILDNVFPTLMTKKSGGSKAGTIGSVVGLILGFFVGPAGVILGPFVGALAGELIHDHSDFPRAFNAAFGAFKGFILGTGLKIISVFICIWVFIFSITNN